MKSIEEIKDEVAQEHNNSSWSDMMFKYGGVGDTIIDKVVHRYAREVAKASLQKAAENAKTYDNCKVWNCEGQSVNIESIVNSNNIVLL
ncbi:hypothetical protein HZP82_15765 [Elizabethkingia anophelis]|nr:hypothetical protein [Elizabethkingia anophelis]MCT4106460.1 hypothetical protein [Elizabethkingia anophelis]